MLSYMLIGAVILIGLYFYMQKPGKNIEEPMENRQLESFIPSDSFSGAKNGYIFKMDESGLGYYLDSI